jgi:ethanolamine utilization protein EutN
MFLAEVIGHVVATKKDESMTGQKLLIVRPKLVDEAKPSQFRDGVNTIVAVDTVGAGEGDLVMFCQGSSARQAGKLKKIPVDAAVVAIVDSVDVLGKKVYGKSSS